MKLTRCSARKRNKPADLSALYESWSHSPLRQRNLHHVELSAAIAVGAAGDVPHVHLVCLGRGERNRLIAIGLQPLGPGVERFSIVRLERLNARCLKAGRAGIAAERRWAAKLPAWKDLLLNELGEGNV